MDRFFDPILRLLYGGEHVPGATTAVEFNPPDWMGDAPRFFNAILVVLATLVVVWAYRRDGRKLGAKIGLGIVRGLILLYVISLINRPVLTIKKQWETPSVLAVMIDTSGSAMVRDTADSAWLATGEMPAPPATAPATQPGELPSAGEAFALMLQQLAEQKLQANGGESVEQIGGTGPTRLDVARGVLAGNDLQLLRNLASEHSLRLYQFSRDAAAIGATPTPPSAYGPAPGAAPSNLPTDGQKSPTETGRASTARIEPELLQALAALRAEGTATQLVPSLLTVLNDLQGQQLAGVVVLTDAHDTPTSVPPAVVDQLKKFGVKIYAVPVGSPDPIRNLAVTALNVQESAFKDDLVSAKVGVKATAYEAGKTVRVTLKNKATGEILQDDTGKPAEATATFADGQPQEVEIVFQPKQVGTLDLLAEVAPEEGELSLRDNSVQNSIAVLDAKVNLLYVDGYPRWEYRYIKNEMIRDKSVNISCLLTSADRNFAQEGDPPQPYFGLGDPRNGSTFPGPITRFPETAEELSKYDVVLFGDVDPRQFTDRQLQLLTNFVSSEAGGFGMVAGPQHSPVSYRGTSVEPLLPVTLLNVGAEDPEAEYRDGWRPVVTDEGRRGEAALMFRFFTDPEQNLKYLREDLQPLFWYSRGVAAKSGVGIVYAEHPVATDPTGRKAPLLVLGRFGAGRTLFNAMDDTWRWRYYTGESVFDTFWVQQVRYLARGRKLAERGIKFSVEKERYERGENVKLTLTVLSPKLLADLPPQIRVDVVSEGGQLVRDVMLLRQDSPDNLYTANFPATDPFGAYRVKLAALSPTVEEQQRPFQIIVPQLELDEPVLDRSNLLRLMPPEQIVPPAQAREKLPEMIKSAAKVNQDVQSRPLLDNAWTVKLWNWTLQIPRVIAIFMGLITTEWVLRKVFGML